jgi:hypothetical protein
VTEITLEKCNVRLSESEFKEMDKTLDAEDVGDALRLSNNGKAPGMDYAEAAEEDGLILALDQEKAYDRINYAYLLRVLQHL